MMFKFTLIAAITALIATTPFANMNAGAMALARPTMVAPPSNALRITEMLVHFPGSSDDGYERIEITNTGIWDIDLATCYFLYIDGRASNNGKVIAMVHLGQGAQWNTLGTNSRILPAGATMVISDLNNSGLRGNLGSEGNMILGVDFNSTVGLSELRDSLGLFALITGPIPGFDAGDNVDANGNGVLDGIYWADTLHCVDMKRGTHESGGESYYSDQGLPDAGGDGYNRVKCRQLLTWTPIGYSLLKDVNTSLWDNALIYGPSGIKSVGNGISQRYEFDPTWSEYTFGVDIGNNIPTTVSGLPRITTGLLSQYVVTNMTLTYAH